jgi:hypothetical protein
MKNKSLFEDLTSLSQIVQLMVYGLKNEWVKLDMETFGQVKHKTFLGIVPYGYACYGCAATATLCEIMQRPFKYDKIDRFADRKDALKAYTKKDVDSSDLQEFENAIDDLRKTRIYAFLYQLSCISSLGISLDIERIYKIEKLILDGKKKGMYKLPFLDNNITDDDIREYQKLADYLYLHEQ